MRQAHDVQQPLGQDQQGQRWRDRVFVGWREHCVGMCLQQETEWGSDVAGEHEDIQVWKVNHGPFDLIGTISENLDLFTEPDELCQSK